MNQIINILSKRSISILIIFVAVISRIINVLFVSYFGRDKMTLVLQSQSLLEGKGLGVPQYLTTDTIAPIYNYTPFWPPGYPILLAPFLKLFNYNIYWATTTLDIIASISLIFIIRRICRQIGFSIAAINTMTLVTGCFEYTFINESLPTDTISVVFFLIGLSFLIKFSDTNNFSFNQILATSFFLFSPCIFRYSYPAISVAAILGLLLIAFMAKNRLLKRKGWWLLAFTGLFIALFLLIIKLTTGQEAYAAPSERGFYPENLINWFPFIPSAFINIAFLTSQAIHLASISFKTSMQWLEIINVLATLALLIFFIKTFFKKKVYENLNPLKLFLFLGGFASLGLLALLGYMSFTYQIQVGLFNNWNYVYEPRYFAFVVLFLQVMLITWLFTNQNGIEKNIFTRIIASICLVALFIEVSHNIYFHTKVAFNFKKYKSEVYREQDYSYYISLLGRIKKEYPDYEIWAAAPGDNFYQYLATYHGHIGIADAESLKNGTLKTTKRTILILMLYDPKVKEYGSFLSANTILQSKKISYSNFYLIELKP
jgi:hypothetical protein